MLACSFVKDFSWLFAHPTTFLIEDSVSAQIMYDILSDFIYWSNCNIFFGNGITIQQKYLFSQTSFAI